MNTLDSIRKILLIVGGTLLLVVVAVVLREILHVLLILFGGILFGVFLDGLTTFVKNKLHLGHGISLTLVVVALLGLAVAAEILAGPRIADQFSLLAEKLPEAYESLKSLLMEHKWSKQLFSGFPGKGQMLPIGKNVLGGITGFFSTVVGGVLTVLIVLIIGFYFAVNPRIYVDNAVRLLPLGKRERGRQVFHQLGHAMRWWLVGRISSMLVVGVLTAIGLIIVQVPLAFVLGLIAALLSFIPYIGPTLSILPAILVALAEDPVLIIYVLMVYAIVQALESYMITPLIQERAVSLPPAILISMQILFGFMAGAFGMLLATPISVVIIALVQMLYIQDVLGDKVELLAQHE